MQIKNLSLSFGTEEIFRDINLNIKEKEKVGIVGVNGAGKTTFFKVILGELEPDNGKVILKPGERVALLPQVISDEIKDMNITVFDYLQTGRPIKKLETSLQREYTKLTNATEEEQNKIYKNIDKIQNKLDYYEYNLADTELLKIIYGMNIDDEMLEKKLCELSGGQKSKIAFAHLLYSKPNIMLLDEPTNHLDESTRKFVINYLKGYKGSVYVISHDINFLNDITTMILYLDKRTKNMELYPGNYDRFLKLHKEREENIKREARAQEKKIEELQTIVNKYSNSSGKRKRMAQDREKKLNKLLENRIEVIEDQKKVRMNIEIDKESSKEPLRVQDVCFKYDKTSDKDIIHNLSFNLTRGEKFLIVGENGVGKSTLLKLIVGKLKQDSGTITLGNKTSIGYYAQEHEILDNNKNILDNFKSMDIPINKLRSYLGGFLFYGDDVYKKIEVLSPGERSRVTLAKIALSGANFLILDEPTNHLDPDTQKIISETFKDYKGTMLVVSHNPEFVDNLGIEKVLVLPEGKLIFYDRKVVEYYESINNSK